MNWIYGQEQPEPISYSWQAGQKHYDIRVCVEEDPTGQDKYRWLEVHLIPGDYEYGQIVSKLIRAKYSQDEMEAALFNDIPEELSPIQAWRAESKRIAKEVLEYIQKDVGVYE